MANDLAALGLPGPGIQILNACADLADLFLLGAPSTYITGLAGLSSGPITGAPVGGTLEAVGPLLTPTVQSWQQFLQSCAHHWLVPPLGPALGPLIGGPPLAVGAPTHFLSPVLAAFPPILCPPLAGSSTGPSPRSPGGGSPEAVGAPIHFHKLPSKFNASISKSSNSNYPKFNLSNSNYSISNPNSPKFQSSKSNSSKSNSDSPKFNPG